MLFLQDTVRNKTVLQGEHISLINRSGLEISGNQLYNVLVKRVHVSCIAERTKERKYNYDRAGKVFGIAFRKISNDTSSL